MDFTLNGRAVIVDAVPGRSLLDVLREDCGLRSMKDGCAPEGSCGACTVIVDGHAVVSCAQPATRVAGRTVETLEGLPEGVRALWADAFVSTGASQCGFCSPGIVMKAEALLRREPEPSREAVGRALAGNLCRCTGYASIIDAIQLAAGVRRAGAGAPGVATASLDGSVARYEGRTLALGEKPFVGDLAAPGMLHGALRFAGVPRAIVRSIDTSRAAAVPGVVAVLTAADVPGRREQGLIVADWPLLVAVGETTRYVGDVLVAVAAETREAAAEAAALVDVDLEPLPPVTDPFEALAPGAPAIHDDGNLVSRSVIRRGDAGAALASAAHVASGSFRTQSIEHAFLEPEAALAVPRGAAGPDGRVVTDHLVHLYSPGQGAWEDRRQVASFLGVAPAEVLVTQVSTGGAFGGKEDLSVQGQAALLAVRTGRPVMLRLTRRESLRFHVKRHPMWLDYTAGCDSQGRLVAVRARIVGDNGAYASVGGKVLERAAGHACGPYRVPDVDIEADAVYTNNPPSGAMRGFGANQAAFAMEGVLDMLAEQVGIDGWEIRWRNALDIGDRCTTGQRMGEGVGVRATLLAVRDAYRGARYAGIACGIKNVGVGNGLPERGRAVLRPETDGTLTLFHSWTEMGQGGPHRPPPARRGGARDAGRPDPGRGGHGPRAGHGRDNILAGHDAGGPCRPAGLHGPQGRNRRRRAGGAGRPRVRRRVPGGLDHEARGGRRGARDALRIRLGDPGRHPGRRGADRARRGGPRRRPGAEPRPAEGPGGGWGPHGARHGPDRGIPGGGRACPSRTPSSRWASSPPRPCRRSRRSSSRCPSRRARSARRGWARRSWCRRPRPWRERSTRTTGSAGRASR